MKVYRLYRKQTLPIGLEQAWDFFSSPHNLAEITPPWLHFTIRSELPERIYSGLMITYTIRVPPGLPWSWTGEIKHVEEPFLFVDEQRAGPYRLWHHQHRFAAVEGGVLMEDEVHYALPFGILGRPAHPIYVRPLLERIFDFRLDYLNKRW